MGARTKAMETGLDDLAKQLNETTKKKVKAETYAQNLTH